MKKLTSYINFSSHFLIISSVAFVFVLGIVVSTPKTFAQATNISVSQNLKVGSTGQDVATLQGLLGEMGYLTMPLNVTFGYYGGLTKNVLAGYQASINLTADGSFGPQTKVAMFTDFGNHNYLRLLGWSTTN